MGLAALADPVVPAAVRAAASADSEGAEAAVAAAAVGLLGVSARSVVGGSTMSLPSLNQKGTCILSHPTLQVEEGLCCLPPVDWTDLHASGGLCPHQPVDTLPRP
mmetsp:Transcript_63025/g.150149  ORF Transcript_63025/g.150149 Transcript_63025/m.150149 type:complete len:105 (+) Transcript_63025:372-686(+)